MLRGLCVACFVCIGPHDNAAAQLSLSSAVSIALQNSSKVKAAENDVQKAQAALSISKDIFIPSLTSAGGVGYSYGITLSVPTIFTVNAQSLVYSSAQRFYIRGAHSDLNAAFLAMADAREQVQEDVTLTYLSLNHVEETIAVLAEEAALTRKLVEILQSRSKAGLTSELDVKRSQRTAIQMKLDSQRAEDQGAMLREHLSTLTGLDDSGLQTVTDSIPPPTPPDIFTARLGSQEAHSFALLSAEANFKARQQRAAGDSRYLYRPQVSFSAEYGRVSPINSVSQYYNLNGHYNVAFAGVQIQFPILDRVRNAASREVSADLQGTRNRLQLLRDDQKEARLKLLHSSAELSTRLELADLDEGIAQDELKAVMIQLESKTGEHPMTPEDEQNARIRERQRYLTLVDTRSEVLQLEVTMLRQAGQLGTWLESTVREVPEKIGPDPVNGLRP